MQITMEKQLKIFLVVLIAVSNMDHAVSQCTNCDAANGDCQETTCFCKSDKWGNGCATGCAPCVDPAHACNATDKCSACNPACVATGTCRAIGAALPVVGCYCHAGYTGDDCSTDIDDCTPNPCEHGGTCTDGVDSYTCDCVDGYTGTNCETDIDDCESNLCQNGATCVDGVNTYTCTCGPEHIGDYCQNEKCHDTNNPCKNGGTCAGSGECTCTGDWIGYLCEIEKCDETSNACENGGTCATSGVCECTTEWTGYLCTINACDDDADCQNGGTCTDKLCICPEDYTGDKCENGSDRLMPGLILVLIVVVAKWTF